MTDDVVISVKNIGVRYFRKRSRLPWRKEEFWALKDVSFDLARGDSVGIIGRNGAGKSTLLQTLAGIISPDRGAVETREVTVSLLSLRLGFVKELSGRENAVLSGMLQGISQQEMLRRLPDILSFSELGDAVEDPVGTYSSGMAARLGFAVALQVASDVLLIDETLSVGDITFKAKSAEALQEIIRSDRTVVLVSHDPGTIESLCDSALWIEDGVVRMEGRTETVLAAYRQEFGGPAKKEHALGLPAASADATG